MVSKASDDLPDPDRPVITTSLLRGISTSIFLRLCSRAPLTTMRSIENPLLRGPRADGGPHYNTSGGSLGSTARTLVPRHREDDGMDDTNADCRGTSRSREGRAAPPLLRRDSAPAAPSAPLNRSFSVWRG